MTAAQHRRVCAMPDCNRTLGRWNQSGHCAVCARPSCSHCGTAISQHSATGMCRRCVQIDRAEQAKRAKARRQQEASWVARNPAHITLPESPWERREREAQGEHGG